MSYEHRLVEVANGSGEFYDKIGRDADAAIATLKNANPTVIAMLELAIGALEGASLAVRQGCASDAPDIVREALADLDALAREALKEKTDGKA